MKAHFVPVLPHHDHDELAVFARLVTEKGRLVDAVPCRAVVAYGRGYRVVGRFASQRHGLVATVNFGLLGSGFESTRRLDDISQLEALLNGDLEFEDLPEA